MKMQITSTAKVIRVYQSNMIKELFEIVNSRLRTPIIGNSIFACLIFNWQAFVLLLFGDPDLDKRIATFSNEATFVSFILLPIVLGLAYSAAHPFISLFGSWLVKRPVQARRLMQLSSDSDYETQKQDFELQRKRRLAKIEEELVAQAKRDEEISNIQDPALREKYASQIDEIRKQSSGETVGELDGRTRDFIKLGERLSPSSLTLLVSAAEDGHGIISTFTTKDGFTQLLGGEVILETTENREVSAVLSHIAELSRADLIETTNGTDAYRVTSLGYDVVSAIRGKNSV